MPNVIVISDRPVALFGGAGAEKEVVNAVLALCGPVVAADGGADVALAHGIVPQAVIGDMDSLSAAGRAAIPPGSIHGITEQETTDFDKALRSIAAPLIIGAGFHGARVDHQLAAFTVLARHADRRCLLAGPEDCVCLMPPRIELQATPGEFLSLFPLGPVMGRSEGLECPIDGIAMTPAGRGGTSNRVTAERVVIEVDAPLMLLIRPRAALAGSARALMAAPARWPAPAR